MTNDFKIIRKITKPFKQQVFLPGSKSIQLRDLVMAALVEGKSIIRGFNDCADGRVMIDALRQMGVSIIEKNDTLEIIGHEGHFPDGEIKINLGESGVSARLLIALAALRKGKTSFDGKESLRRRPQKYLLDTLERMGCKVKSTEDGYLPLEIEGGNFITNKISMKGDKSSQYFTALMLMAPFIEGGLEIEVEGELVSKPYIDITIDEMVKFAVKVQNDNYQKFLIKEYSYVPRDIQVEGDASAASYFMALATLHGFEVTLKNLGANSKQGDLNFYKICEKLGANVELSDGQIRVIGPKKGALKALDSIDMESMPDSAVTLMAIAPFIPGGIKISGLATLKLKECDRIECPAKELRKLGVQAETGADFVHIFEKTDFSDVNLSAIEIETYSDHRMAMSFAVLGTKVGRLKISDPACVNKTFPNFWVELDQLYQDD